MTAILLVEVAKMEQSEEKKIPEIKQDRQLYKHTMVQRQNETWNGIQLVAAGPIF